MKAWLLMRLAGKIECYVPDERRQMDSNREMLLKVALVTGASRGIGRAIALELATAGVTVVVNYLKRREEAENIVKTIESKGGVALAHQADVSDRGAVDAMFDAIDGRLGRLDILVNNAGIGSRIDSITAISDETWRRTFAVNLDGAFYCLRAAIPRLRTIGHGRIVNISSGAAHTGGAIGAHYAASKAGLLALTAKAARELARSGIAVNAVLPSVIETEMLDEIATGIEALENLRKTFPIGRFGRPEEVAQVVRFLCLEAPDYLTGEFISIRGARL
jgi:3-oxoacyl-[acyl-carrier protein] reductase